jgi:hypothetical protein
MSQAVSRDGGEAAFRGQRVFLSSLSVPGV